MNLSFTTEIHPPPTTEEYASSCAALDGENSGPVIAYFTKLRNHYVAMMNTCFIGKTNKDDSPEDRALLQEHIEQARARYRKAAARAEYYLGLAIAINFNHCVAWVHFAQAVELDPTVQRYRDDLIETRVQKSMWERAIRKAG